ncbi:MAG: hypothetical protein IJO06_10035 [Thermoguttaceae bacterium]|nr:hypothetical protein [Thermoguttaceae bacterium]
MAKRAFWASAALLGCVALGTENVAAERLSETAQVASSLPNPGDDWILRASDGRKKVGDEDDERSALASVAAVGKIVAVDSTGIETEDRRRDRRERTSRRPGDAILFLPPVDPSAAEAFCVEIWEAPGARDRDRFWLRNGDEFDGETLKIDRRRVWIRAFGVEFAVPRGRVRAVRFAENDKVEKIGKK